jgi:hypothetical protein
LDTQDQSLFASLATTLFGTAQIEDPAFKQLLALVVLMHFPAMEREYPACVACAKIYQCATQCVISVDKLCEWSERARRQFVTLNAELLPFSSMEAEDVIPVKSITSGFVDVSNCLRGINTTLFNMSEQINALKDEVRAAKTSGCFSDINDESHPNQPTINNNTSSNTSSSNSSGGNNGNITQPPSSIQQVSMRNFITTSGRLQVHSANGADLFSDKLSSLTVENVMYNWYAFELHSVNTKLNTPDRARQGDFARNIYYYKRFLPDNTTIPKKPSPADPVALAEWTAALSQYSSTVHARVENFIREKKTDRQRQSATTFYSASKILRSFSLSQFPSPHIIDAATSVQWCVTDAQIEALCARREASKSDPSRNKKVGNKRKAVVLLDELDENEHEDLFD